MSSLITELLESLRHPDQTVRRWAIQSLPYSIKQGLVFWFILHILWLLPHLFWPIGFEEEAIPTAYGLLYIIGIAAGQILLWWAEVYLFWRSLRFFATPCTKWPFLTTLFWQSIAITLLNVFVTWLKAAMILLYTQVLSHEFNGSSADDLFALIDAALIIYHLVILYKAAHHHTNISVLGYIGAQLLTLLLLFVIFFAISLIVMFILVIVGLTFSFILPFMHWQDFLP